MIPCEGFPRNDWPQLALKCRNACVECRQTGDWQKYAHELAVLIATAQDELDWLCDLPPPPEQPAPVPGPAAGYVSEKWRMGV